MHKGRPQDFGNAVIAGFLLATCPALAQTAPTSDDPDGDADAEERSNGSGMELAPIGVEAPAPDLLRTEDNPSYRGSSTSLGLGTPTSLKETPQSVSVVTRKRMDDQNLTTIEDTMDATAGMNVATGDLINGSIYSRGHEVLTYQLDGLAAPYQSIYGTTPSMAVYDRVEVLRGPAGLVNGQSSPGGMVNLARKRALTEPRGQAKLSAGSWATRRGMLDYTGPLTADGALRGRAVAAYEEGDSFVDQVDNERTTGYATLEYDVADATTLSLAATYDPQKITRFSGLPTLQSGKLLDVDPSTFIGADWNNADISYQDMLAELEHSFAGGGQARVATRLGRREADLKSALGTGGVDPNTRETNLLGFRRDYEEDTTAIDARLTLPLEAFGQNHEYTVGADYRRFDQVTRQRFAMLGTQNVDNPDHDVAEPDIPFQPGPGYLNQKSEPEQTGVYGQFRLAATDAAEVILGGRYSQYSQTVTERDSGQASSEQQLNEFTPYAGMTYDLDPVWTAYASYTTSFEPQPTSTDADGDPLDPREGAQAEAGIKAAWLEGRLAGQFAIYQLTDKNRAVTVSPGTSEESGETETTGFEAELSGQIGDYWNLYAAYTYADAEITGDDSDTFGSFTPKHQGDLWVRYDLEGAGLEGVSAGGGLNAVSDFFSNTRGTRIEADGYEVVDLQLAYAITDSASATLSANNVLDREYFQRVGNTGDQNFYGEPRNYQLKVDYNF